MRTVASTAEMALLLEQTREFRQAAKFIKSLSERTSNHSDAPTKPPLRFTSSHGRKAASGGGRPPDSQSRLSEREAMHRIQALCSKFEALASTVSQEEQRHNTALAKSTDLRNVIAAESDQKVSSLVEQLQEETERRTRLEEDVSMYAAHTTDNFHVKQLSEQLQKKIEVSNSLQVRVRRRFCSFLSYADCPAVPLDCPRSVARPRSRAGRAD